jgi:hypothetical protein
MGGATFGSLRHTAAKTKPLVMPNANKTINRRFILFLSFYPHQLKPNRRNR